MPPTSALRERQLDGRWRAGGVHDEVEAPLRASILECHGAQPDRERGPVRVDISHDDLGAAALQRETHERSLGSDSDDEHRGGHRSAEPSERRLDDRHRLDADEVLRSSGGDPPRVLRAHDDLLGERPGSVHSQ